MLQKLSKLSDQIISAAALLFAFSYLVFVRVADPDLFARMAVGRLIFDLKYLPFSDPFAFSPKKEIWIDHEWLSGVAFYFTWLELGEPGLLVLRGIFVALIMTLLYQGMQCSFSQCSFSQCSFSQYSFLQGSFSRSYFLDANNNNDKKINFIYPLFYLFFFSSYLWTTVLRAQLLSYLFFAWLFLALLKFEQGKFNYLLIFSLLVPFWANWHGGFVLGLLLLAIWSATYLISAKFCKKDLASKGIILVAILLFSILASLLNPYPALSYWSYLFDALIHPRPAIDEWQAVGLFSFEGALLYGTLFFVLIAYLKLYYSTERERFFACLPSLMVILSLAYAAASSYRFLAAYLFAISIFSLPVLANYFRQDVAKNRVLATLTTKFLLSLKIAAPILALLGIVKIIYMTQFASFLDYRSYPVEAVEYLKNNEKGGKLLVDFNSGSYAIWKLYPKYQVSLDGRYEELYPDATVELVDRALNINQTISNRKEALKILQPDYILLSPSTSLINFFGDEWQVVFSSVNGMVYKKIK
jgi:hypothetical protein